MSIQQAAEEASMICSNILGEIVGAATDSSETMDQVCDSILNLDVIYLDCPGTYSDPIFHKSPMEVELEERDELLLLDSPAPSPPLHLYLPRPLTLTLCTPTVPLTSGL